MRAEEEEEEDSGMVGGVGGMRLKMLKGERCGRGTRCLVGKVLSHDLHRFAARWRGGSQEISTPWFSLCTADLNRLSLSLMTYTHQQPHRPNPTSLVELDWVPAVASLADLLPRAQPNKQVDDGDL